jgi:hypothetical protein
MDDRAHTPNDLKAGAQSAAADSFTCDALSTWYDSVRMRSHI